MTALITLHGAGVQADDRWLIQDVELCVRGGELTMLVGPNGAGKSTLLSTLADDLKLSAGRRRTPAWPQHSRAWLARHLAVLPQYSELNFAFSAAEVVGLARTPHASGVRHDQKIVDAALAAMDVAHLAGASYTRLSGGERQRVQLARVLAQVWEAVDDAPRLLLLDEPTAALDLSHQRELMRLLKRLVTEAGAGLGVVAVMHDLNLAAAFADRVVCLSEGRVVADGTVHEVLSVARIADVFACQVSLIPHPVSGRPVLLYED